MFSKKKEPTKKEEESPISTRKRLYKSLSQSEKSLRRSTIGPLSYSNNSGLKLTELESPFVKVVRDGQQNSEQNEQSTRRKVNLSAEEKKSRRKSLLAPMQNFFSVSLIKDKKDHKNFKSLDSISTSQSSKSDSKKKKNKLFKKKKDTDSTENKNDQEERLKKERKKKLQKELDKIEKEKEKVNQSNMLLSLNQALNVGNDDIKIPVPSMKIITIQPTRPPPVFKA